MKMIVGLGNPGNEYKYTRHNIGFIFIDNYAKSKNVEINKNKFNGLYTIIKINKEDVILLKPQSYMNLSGEIVKKFVDYFNIDIASVLIINDDLDLDIGVYRLRKKGSSAGHNGLKNIELYLGTNEYKRLKIGISNNKNIDTKDYVTSKFNDEEYIKILNLEGIINNIIDDYLNLDFELLMSKYNN